MQRAARQQQLAEAAQRGFTIIELLVVIVVIGILAAITIVAYNGVTQRAHAVALESDLSNGATALEVTNSTDGQYPASASGADNGQGLKASPGNTFTYNVSGDGSTYCLQASGYGMTYVVSNSNSAPQIGYCSGTVALSGTPLPPNGGIVTTLAGSGAAGYADGTGTAAQFNYPMSVAVDASGDVYVADTLNNRIRKITSGGTVTTFAGSGSPSFADGTGTAAGFNSPYSVAVDASGNIYVADTSNQCIRKITPSGVVTTLAGSGTRGFADGTGAAAEFNYPEGIAVDASGNVYVADDSNERIRKISPSGDVTTLAGSGTAGLADGTGTAAQFDSPDGIVVDSSGNVYVAEAGTNRIRKVTANGVVTAFVGAVPARGSGGYADGTGTAAKFLDPFGLATDSSGNIYVADTNNHRIREVTPAGVVSTLAGSGTAAFADGTGTAAQFNYPGGVAVDSSGAVYVADSGNNRIRVIK